MKFRSVATVEEALDTIDRLGESARVIAGGTDVMIQRMTGQLPRSETLVYIGRLSDLRGVHQANGTIRIGALTTHSDLRTDPIIASYLPSFLEAAGTVGGWQTQAVGTLGGNLCNASPAADLAPPVLVSGATLVVSGPDGTERIPADRFFLDRRRTALQPGQLLVSIEVPIPPDGMWESYLKVGRRSAMEVALVGLAARFTIAGGVITSARLAFCSVAPTPLRIPGAEDLLVGSTLNDEAVDEAVRTAVDSLRPIDDHRATASYRSKMVGRLIHKAARLCRTEMEGRG